MTDTKCEPPPEWRDRDGWHWLGDAPVRWMSEINKWEWGEDDWLKPSQVPAGFPYNGPCLPPATVAALEAERDRMKHAASAINETVCQTLGAVLGYPWLKDDQKNFPGATEADGVCVGDHVAESIASEAAAKLATVAALVEALEVCAKQTTTQMVHDQDTGFERHEVPTAEAKTARAALALYRGEAGR